MPPAGTRAPGWRKTPGLPHPFRSPSSAVSRADRPVRVKPPNPCGLTRPARPAFPAAGRRRRDGPGLAPLCAGTPFKKGGKMHTEPPGEQPDNAPCSYSGIGHYCL